MRLGQSTPAVAEKVRIRYRKIGDWRRSTDYCKKLSGKCGSESNLHLRKNNLLYHGPAVFNNSKGILMKLVSTAIAAALGWHLVWRMRSRLNSAEPFGGAECWRGVHPANERGHSRSCSKPPPSA